MFARIVRMKLKSADSSEFSRVLENDVLPVLRKQQGFRDEITFVSSDGKEAVGISLWDEKQHADAYTREGYAQVTRLVNKVVDGTPQVQTYEVANSTFHHISARAAA